MNDLKYFLLPYKDKSHKKCADAYSQKLYLKREMQRNEEEETAAVRDKERERATEWWVGIG